MVRHCRGFVCELTLVRFGCYILHGNSEAPRVQILCSDERVLAEMRSAAYDVETQCRISIDIVRASEFHASTDVRALTHSVSDACKGEIDRVQTPTD